MTISTMMPKFYNYVDESNNRAGTAVFIPLAILALQLDIADKIPVVGYYTLMDMCSCFITSMMDSIESGFVYALVPN